MLCLRDERVGRVRLEAALERPNRQERFDAQAAKR
jgi:hypothetical protein